MDESKNTFFERKMEMMKKREEMMNAMDEKQLRAFIKGYMMGERMAFKQVEMMSAGCDCDSHGCSCGGGHCECEGRDHEK